MFRRGSPRLGPSTVDAEVQTSPDVANKSTQVELHAHFQEKFDAATQVGEAFVRGPLYMMLHAKSLRTVKKSLLEQQEDPLIRVFGEFGRWQFMVEIVLFLYNIPYVFQLVVAEFEGNLFGEYWCARPERLANLSVETWKQISAVFNIKGGMTSYDPCYKKNMNYDDLLPSDPRTWVHSGDDIPCTSWEYESDYSIVSEWNLACTHPSATTAAESILAIGGLLGCAVSGYFTDRKGRRIYIMICQAVNTLISFITGLSPHYWFYLAFRGIQGFCIVGCYPSLCILSMELTGKTWTGLVGSTFMYSFPVGYMLCSILAYYVESWRHLHYAVTFLSVSLLTAVWVLPESPRWLWIQKKHARLMILMEEASKMNRKSIVSHEILQRVKTTGPMTMHTDQLNVRWSDLYGTKVLRKLSFVSSPLFFFAYVAYYGVVLRLNIMFPVNVFRANMFTGVVEFTATTISLSMAARKWLSDAIILFVSCLISGILFLLINALPESSQGIPYCIMFARFFMAILNTNLMLYISELYPTKMRGLGIGIANTFNFLALFVTANFFRLERMKEGLPVFLMGIAGVISGFLVLLLPVPRDSRTIPDTIDQVEDPFAQEFHVIHSRYGITDV